MIRRRRSGCLLSLVCFTTLSLTSLGKFHSSTFVSLRLIPICTVVEGVNATPYEDNMRYFNVAIAGPVGTCYEGKFSSFYEVRYERRCCAVQLSLYSIDGGISPMIALQSPTIFCWLIMHKKSNWFCPFDTIISGCEVVQSHIIMIQLQFCQFCISLRNDSEFAIKVIVSWFWTIGNQSKCSSKPAIATEYSQLYDLMLYSWCFSFNYLSHPSTKELKP